MGQTLCCQADDIDHLIDRNHRFPFFSFEWWATSFLEDGFGQHKPLLNSPSTYNVRKASSLSASSISTVDGNHKNGFQATLIVQ